jgi:hypothetical protein
VPEGPHTHGSPHLALVEFLSVRRRKKEARVTTSTVTVLERYGYAGTSDSREEMQPRSMSWRCIWQQAVLKGAVYLQSLLPDI